ncbi:MAG: tyrosine--tRNA ligase [Deltaproteobacteria bacterium]|nr:tyrosine--tRNA ligase [Deltaproteobacteria bacterium]
MTDIFAELTWRGLIHQSTDDGFLPGWLTSGMRTLYAGFDPTADSLHVGHMLPLLNLRRFQRAGHRPIALVGGATGMIGDPSGKSEERNLLSVEVLQANIESIRGQMQGFLDFDAGDSSAVLANNFDWKKGFSYLDFLRDIGKNFPVNVMLAKDSVKGRLERTDGGLSYTEFSYMLLQAYDFVHLAKNHDCRLQVGGSDQWGNITAGNELSRKLGGPQLYGLTAPLLLDAQGEKMGKTASGQRIWLDPKLTSPYAFYQYWLNVEDADVDRLLKIFSRRTLEEIDAIVKAHAEAPHKRAGQRALAEDLTTWVHGAQALRRAIAASQVMFGGSLVELSDADLEPLLADVPSSELSRNELDSGVALLDLLVNTKLAASKGAARRLVQGGGVYVNNERVGDVNLRLEAQHLGTETMIVLRSGKKSYHVVRVVA